MSGAAQRVLFATHGLVKRFGGLTATDGVSIAIRQHQVHALIGPNGAGKSTLVNLISGHLLADDGRIELDGQDLTRLAPHLRARRGLARCFQLTSIFERASVADNLRLAIQAGSGSSFRFMRPRSSEADLDWHVVALARRVELHADLDRTAADLPHGARRRLDLALALAGRPCLLLLDEPMAGMGAQEASQLVGLIEDLRRETTILLIEHDMDAVFRLADEVTVLVEGRVLVNGTPESVRADPRVQSAYLGTDVNQ